MSRPFNAPDVFRAIADPHRRKMILLLRKSDLSPGELTQYFKLSRPAIAQHLRTLRLAGLIKQRRRGKGLIYSILPHRLSAVSKFVSQAIGGANTRARSH